MAEKIAAIFLCPSCYQRVSRLAAIDGRPIVEGDEAWLCLLAPEHTQDWAELERRARGEPQDLDADKDVQGQLVRIQRSLSELERVLQLAAERLTWLASEAERG
jgi:hypothetical protein